MEIEQFSNSNYPPGFRFHPSDEELIVHYLLKKLGSRPLPADVVAEIELYSFNPWELPNKSLFGEDEWYFFTPRDRKYPNGERPNRTAGSGYWKATGTDKPILSASGSRSIGVKKALVFYKGRPPKGVKTDWIMTEYRLPDTLTRSSRSKGSKRLDDWVLCRVRQKGNMSKHNWAGDESPNNPYDFLPKIEELPSAYTNTNTTEIMTDNNYLLKDCHILASMLACQDLPPIQNISNSTLSRRNYNNNNNNNNYNNSVSNPYNHTFDKGNSFITNSFFFESFLNPTKVKLNDENVIGFDKIVTEIHGSQVVVPANVVTTNEMSFYNQDQAHGMHMFNPNQWDPNMNLLLCRNDI